MEKNTPKYSNNHQVRQSLQNIPDDLFYDANLYVKVRLVKNEFIKDPLRLAVLIKRMMNENKWISDRKYFQ